MDHLDSISGTLNSLFLCWPFCSPVLERLLPPQLLVPGVLGRILQKAQALGIVSLNFSGFQFKG